MNLTASTFPFHLKRVREVMFLTQEELADRTGLHPSAISHFETGNRHPSLINFVKLCNALNTEPSRLLARIK